MFPRTTPSDDVSQVPTIPTVSATPKKTIDEVVARLSRRFGATISQQTIETTVRNDFERFTSARVRDFIPVLVEKDAYDELRALAG